MPTNAELMGQLSALLGRRDLSQAEFSGWMAGAEDGGPNGDGLFPLTDSTGFIRMVPSPAKLAEVARGGDGGTYIYPDNFDPLAGSGPDHDDADALQAMFDQQLIDGRRPAFRVRSVYYPRRRIRVDPSRNSLEGNHSQISFARRTDFVNPDTLPDLLEGHGDFAAASAGAWTVSPNHTMDYAINGSLVGTPPPGEQRYTEIGRAIIAPAGSVIRLKMTVDYITPHTVGSNTFRDIGISFRRLVNNNVAASIGGGGNVSGSVWFYSSNTAGYTPGVTVEREFTITADNPVLRIQSNAAFSISWMEIKVVPDNSCFKWTVPPGAEGGQLRGHNYREWRNFKVIGRPGQADARFVDAWLFDTPLYTTNDLGQHTRVNVYNVDISDGVGRGIVKKDRTYLSNFFGCRIVCAVAGLDIMEGTHDAGENIAFFGGNFGGGDIAIRNRGQFELHFFGTSFDFSRQWYVGAGGALFFGCHFETNATTLYAENPEKYPRIHVLGGHVHFAASKLQVNGSTEPNLEYPIIVEKGGKVTGIIDTAYNLKGTFGAIVGGEGRWMAEFKGGANKEIDAIVSRAPVHNVIGTAGKGGLGIGAIPVFVRARTEQGQKQLDRYTLGFPTNGGLIGDVERGSNFVINTVSPTTGQPYQPTSTQLGAYLTNPETDADTSIVESINGGTFTGSTVLGSDTITGVTPLPTSTVMGRYITGPGIARGTKIIGYSNAGATVKLSEGARATSAAPITVNMGYQVRLSKPWTGATANGFLMSTTKPSEARAGVRIAPGGRTSDNCLEFYKAGIGNANIVYTLALPCLPGRAFGSEFYYSVAPDPAAGEGTTTNFYLQAHFARIEGPESTNPIVCETQFISDLPQTNINRNAGRDWTYMRAATNRTDVTSEHDGHAPDWATHFIWTINISGTPGAFNLKIADIHGNNM